MTSAAQIRVNNPNVFINRYSVNDLNLQVLLLLETKTAVFLITN
jgi:hypothetical protein